MCGLTISLHFILLSEVLCQLSYPEPTTHVGVFYFYNYDILENRLIT